MNVKKNFFTLMLSDQHDKNLPLIVLAKGILHDLCDIHLLCCVKDTFCEKLCYNVSCIEDLNKVIANRQLDFWTFPVLLFFKNISYIVMIYITQIIHFKTAINYKYNIAFFLNICFTGNNGYVDKTNGISINHCN